MTLEVIDMKAESKRDTSATDDVCLSEALLAHVPEHVAMPKYDRAHVQTGIVHLGPGAFHRAHQAVYVDDILSRDNRWGICGVSINSAGVRKVLKKQDFLYSLSILDDTPSTRIIGSIQDVLFAGKHLDRVLSVMAAESTKIVSLTVTENGYCLTPEGDLDTNRPEIQHDLKMQNLPVSATGLIVEALRRRYSQGFQPFTVLSCDNLSGNGQKLRRSVCQFARAINVDLAYWIEASVPFPATMVDSITPATDEALKQQVFRTTGLLDGWPIQREAFTQWVIEDEFIERPALEEVGVQFTNDVTRFETCKLHLLNGTHSSLAYLGFLAGYEAVSDAMRDDLLSAFLKKMMRSDILPVLDVPAGMDTAEYSASIIKRYENAGIRHLLSQIAWDGSQKLPIRIMPILEKNLKLGKRAKTLVASLAAWLRFLEVRTKAGVEIKDPLAAKLTVLIQGFTGDSKSDLSAFVKGCGIFPERLADNTGFMTDLVAAYEGLSSSRDSVHKYLKMLLEAE